MSNRHTGIEATFLVLGDEFFEGYQGGAAQFIDDLKTLPSAQMHERFAAAGVEIALDFIAHLKRELTSECESDKPAAIYCHSKSSAGLVDGDDSAYVHGHIVQQGGAA